MALNGEVACITSRKTNLDAHGRDFPKDDVDMARTLLLTSESLESGIPFVDFSGLSFAASSSGSDEE